MICKICYRAAGLAILFFFAVPAKAGIFVEPSLGYESGSGKFETAPAATLPARETQFKGNVFGIRLGAKVSSFWIGLEPSYSQGSLTSNYPTQSRSSSDSYSQTKVFGLIGFDFPHWLRAWGGVGVYNSQKESFTSSQTTILSNSYKIGSGIQWKKLGVNLEYVMETPTKINDSVTGEVSLSTQYSKTALSRAVFSLSWIF